VIIYQRRCLGTHASGLFFVGMKMCCTLLERHDDSLRLAVEKPFVALFRKGFQMKGDP
jgi:hypothetical protein